MGRWGLWAEPAAVGHLAQAYFGAKELKEGRGPGGWTGAPSWTRGLWKPLEVLRAAGAAVAGMPINREWKGSLPLWGLLTPQPKQAAPTQPQAVKS